MSGPSAVLAFPHPDTPIPASVELLLGLADWVSPSYYVRLGMEMVLDVDPVEWLTTRFTGDWHGVAQAAAALTQLGRYVDTLGSEVERTSAQLFQGWSGQAAGAATDYLARLAGSITELRAPLGDIARAFETAAVGVKQCGAAIADLLGILLDTLIEIGIAVCATTSVAWTGVGAAVGGSGMAYLAYKASSTWLKVVELHGWATTLARGAIGATAGPLSVLGLDSGLDLSGLPCVPYDHVSVT